MERIINVNKILSDIGVTLDWMEGVTWKEADLHAVRDPFGDEYMLSMVRLCCYRLSYQRVTR